MRKKAKVVMALLLATGMALSGMDGMAGPVKVAAGQVTLKLNKTQVSVEKGKKITLKVVKKNVKKIVSTNWSSNNKKVAAVSNKGTVTGKKAGASTAVICKVKYKVEGSKEVYSKKLKCKVKVKKAAAPANDPSQPSSTPQVEKSDALIPKIMEENQVEQNPYLSDEEAMIHNDIYNSDVTVKAMPLGIYPEIVESIAKNSPNAPAAFYYDNFGNAVAPYTQIMEDGNTLAGGIAIRDMDSSDLKILGKFQPSLDDNAAYGIQMSYSFVDKDNYLVGPTSHGHVIMVATYDSEGNILPIFEKKLDVDIVSEVVRVLGEDIDKNLLSIAYDYEGNLWFVTGGFHKNPSYSKAGFVGYLERDYIDRALAGEDVSDVAKYIHCKKLAGGGKMRKMALLPTRKVVWS